MKKTIGEIISEKLKEHNMKQKDLADRVGVTPQAVSDWVQNKKSPDPYNMQSIDEILGTNLVRTTLIPRIVKGRKNTNMKIKKLEEIGDFETAKSEAKRILDEVEIERKYSHSVYLLLSWLLSAVIGLTCYQKKNNIYDDVDEDNIFLNLYDYIGDSTLLKKNECYENYLEYNFYLLGMDLAEMNGEENEEYGFVQDAMSYWYRFYFAIIKSESSQIYNEIKVAITEICE